MEEGAVSWSRGPGRLKSFATKGTPKDVRRGGTGFGLKAWGTASCSLIQTLSPAHSKSQGCQHSPTYHSSVSWAGSISESSHW